MWPVKVVDIKDYLGIDHDNVEADTMLDMARTSAQKRIESYCGRRFLTATRTYYLDGNSTDLLLLPDYPITSITSVVNNIQAPRDWTVTALSSDYYQIYNDHSTMHDEGKHSVQRIDGGVWSAGKNNWRVIAVTGYAATSIPEDLHWAGVELAAHIYLRADRKSVGLTSRSEQGGSSGYDLERSMPVVIKEMLDPYKHLRAFGIG